MPVKSPVRAGLGSRKGMRPVAAATATSLFPALFQQPQQQQQQPPQQQTHHQQHPQQQSSHQQHYSHVPAALPTTSVSSAPYRAQLAPSHLNPLALPVAQPQHQHQQQQPHHHHQQQPPQQQQHAFARHAPSRQVLSPGLAAPSLRSSDHNINTNGFNSISSSSVSVSVSASAPHQESASAPAKQRARQNIVDLIYQTLLLALEENKKNVAEGRTPRLSGKIAPEPLVWVYRWGDYTSK